MNLEEWDIGKIISKGAFGFVLLIRNKETKDIKVGKFIKIEKLETVDKTLKKEINILESLDHRNIIKYYEHVQTDEFICLIFEYMPNGDLYEQVFTTETCKYIIKQVVDAVNYCHSRNILHRDVKPENVLRRASDNLIKLCDFGFSKSVSTKEEKCNTFCGTLDYLSPEQVQCLDHNYKVDVWMIGILLYEISVGKPPFEAPSRKETYKNICDCEITFPDDYELKDDVLKFIQKDPNDRIELDDFLKDLL